MQSRCPDGCCHPEVDDDLSASLLGLAHVRASRKRRICGDCSRPIEIGEPYVRTTFVTERRAWSTIRHTTDGACLLVSA